MFLFLLYWVIYPVFQHTTLLLWLWGISRRSVDGSKLLVRAPSSWHRYSCPFCSWNELSLVLYWSKSLYLHKEDLVNIEFVSSKGRFRQPAWDQNPSTTTTSDTHANKEKEKKRKKKKENFKKTKNELRWMQWWWVATYQWSELSLHTILLNVCVPIT